MESLLIINGSPRAPRSNSKRYSELFTQSFTGSYDQLQALNYSKSTVNVDDYSDILLVFPLYADSIPTPLMTFLKIMSQSPKTRQPTIHVLINCGFLEPEQNIIAVEMLQFYAKQFGFSFGSVLMVGSGEAILNTPFSFLVKRRIRKLAASIQTHNPLCQSVTMPLPKSIFLSASTKYWLTMGAKHGQTKETMSTMSIEKE